MQIRKNDMVVVITGKNRGAQGQVLRAMPDKGKVIVENINMVKRHMKPRAQGQPGNIVEKEAPIDASNVMLVCPKCKKGVRVGYMTLENKTKVRVCKKCGTTISE
jgi:large subunit ribosomal protein L24